MRTLKYALIGCGRIAAKHIQAVYANGLEFVAMCDVDESKFDAMLGKAGYSGCSRPEYSGAARYADYRLMLEEHPEIELVAIATPSGMHAAVALDCIDAGKHLIIEKPIALSIADADEIVRRAAVAGVKVAACHQNRFNPAIQKLRKALDAGRFGRLSHGSVHVRWNRNRQYYDQAPWRGTWAQDGGALMNQCIHGIDLLRWMMGDEPVEVYGATRRRFHDYIEAEDVGLAVVKFANGVIATIEGTANVYPQNLEELLCVFGESGTVKIGGTAANRIDVWDFADDSGYEIGRGDFAGQKCSAAKASDIYGSGHVALYADVVNAIANDREPYVGAVAGRNAVEMVLAIYKSQKTGQPVSLPFADFATVDMRGEFQ